MRPVTALTPNSSIRVMKGSREADILIASNHGLVLSSIRMRNTGGNMSENKQKAELWKGWSAGPVRQEVGVPQSGSC